jgi:guanylate cyclase
VALILTNMSTGLHFLHWAESCVVHGDIKSHNILIDDHFHAKIADFGLSSKSELGNPGSLGFRSFIPRRNGRSTSKPCGTPLWMAPELLRGEGNTAMSDVYAFGIVIYEVYSRSYPYDSEDTRTVLQQVADATLVPPKRPTLPSSCPPRMAHMMQECWASSPAHRPTTQALDSRMSAMSSGECDPLLSCGPKGQHASSRKLFALGISSRALGSHIEQPDGEPDGDRMLRMIYDTFPKHIADTLRAGRRVEPERKECVTIFFSDIVGFTDLSATMSAEKVMDMLDRLYTKFDALSVKHDIFKVETIGDAYMAVTNLVKNQDDDHSLRIAWFAVEAIESAAATLIDEQDPSKGVIQIRVGLHSGPVVATVVGTRNLRYCLFGDTVNTASRMESTSIKMRIHCSQATAILLSKTDEEDRLLIQERGLIEIKGKGRMLTYWVSRKPWAREREIQDRGYAV